MKHFKLSLILHIKSVQCCEGGFYFYLEFITASTSNFECKVYVVKPQFSQNYFHLDLADCQVTDTLLSLSACFLVAEGINLLILTFKSTLSLYPLSRLPAPASPWSIARKKESRKCSRRTGNIKLDFYSFCSSLRTEECAPDQQRDH